MAKRLQAMGQPNYVNGFKLTMHEHVLEKPLEWKTLQVIFVNSMSDLFHKDVPLEFVQRVFDVMKRAHWHQFQVLTKRSERLAELSPYLEWTDNIWMGVSVENKDYVYRIDDLRKTGAKIKFLSVEPLLLEFRVQKYWGLNKKWNLLIIVFRDKNHHQRVPRSSISKSDLAGRRSFGFGRCLDDQRAC